MILIYFCLMYRNGNRLSGLFIIAMNLYLRTRMEQQLDIVLEIKLAHNSRPQFIPDVVRELRIYMMPSSLWFSFVQYFWQRLIYVRPIFDQPKIENSAVKAINLTHHQPHTRLWLINFGHQNLVLYVNENVSL